MKYRHIIAASCIALGAGALTSCVVDDSWNLDDIDWTFGTKTDITFPTSSTGDIILKNILDLEEDGVVQIMPDPAGGADMYVVTQSGSADIEPLTVEDIKIDRPTVNSFDTNVDLSSVINHFSSQHRAPRRSQQFDLTVGGQRISVELPDVAYTYRITDADHLHYELRDVEAGGIHADLRRLDAVTMEGATFTLSVTDVILKNCDYANNIHFDEMTINMPKGIHVKEATFRYNGKSHPVEVDNAHSRLILTKADSEAIDVTRGIEIEATMSEARVGDDIVFTPGANGEKGKVKMLGRFRIDGQFRLESTELDHARLQEALNRVPETELLKQMGSDGKLHLDLVKLGIVPDAINVKGGGQFYSDIHITSVTGRVEHEVGEIDPLNLDDLPDFLGDDDVVLDLANPLLFVTVENGLPATANTLLSLSATVGGVQTERATSSISVKPGHNLFMLADHDTNVRPAKYADATFIPVKDLGGIIRKIPEQVNITVAPVTVEAEHFPIPGTFPIDVDYEVWAPLSFGPDFRLVYQGTERGWSEDLGDLEDVDFECIEMVGQIDSDLPAAIHLSVEPLDCELRPLAYVEAIAVDVPSSAKNHPFTIAFRAKAGHTLNDVLTGSNGSEQLDGVRYKAVVDDPAADATLRAGAKVRLHDVHITIKGGITVDAN